MGCIGSKCRGRAAAQKAEKDDFLGSVGEQPESYGSNGPGCLCCCFATKGSPNKTITIANQSSKEVLVFVVEDPNALRLKKKTVSSEGSGGAKAGAYGVGVNLDAKKGSTIEYEAEGNSSKVQKIRIKPGNNSLIFVDQTSLIAVLFYRDNLYHLRAELRFEDGGRQPEKRIVNAVEPALCCGVVPPRCTC